MTGNVLRQRLRDGKTSLGCFLGLASPAIAETMAHAGYDWLIIETEHTALHWPGVEGMIRAIEAAGTDTVPIVRVPSASQEHIQIALDIGARGVIVPMVRSAAEAEAVVAATRFPPSGRRGFGPLRAGGYTINSLDYFEAANENIAVILILETLEALEDLDAICRVPGIDALYMGFADLSLAMGLTPFKLPNPDMDAVIERVLDTANRHGMAIGHGSTSPDGLEALVTRGYRLLGFGPDYCIVADAAKAGRAAHPRD